MATAKSKTRYNFAYGSIYQRVTKRGNIRWYVDYRDGRGRRVQKVVSSAITAEEAKLALQREVQRTFDHEYGLSREKSAVRFDNFTQLYIDDYAKAKKRSWQRSDQVYLRAQLIPHFGKMMLSEIKQLQVEQYISRRLNDKVARRPKDKVKQSTINRELACLRKIMNKAIDWGYLNVNPVSGVKFFSEKDNLQERILGREEEGRLLEASCEHLKPILTVALHTGMRRGEILNLKWSQVDLKAGMIRVEMTKSGRTRFVYINGVLLKLLKNLQEASPCSVHVFTNPKTGKPLTDVKRAFLTACKRAGISQLRFHDLRHTFASRLIENGSDLITVKDLLGHGSVKTTERYTHAGQDQKRRAVESLVRQETRSEGLSSASALHCRDTGDTVPTETLPTPLLSMN